MIADITRQELPDLLRIPEKYRKAIPFDILEKEFILVQDKKSSLPALARRFIYLEWERRWRDEG